MPTCRRKRVVLTEPSPALLEALKEDPSRDVFYLERTGELFETYEFVPQPLFTPTSLTIHLLPTLGTSSGYAARMSFYRQKQFQCEVTGKSGLNYFEALDSEELEARTMHSRFPEPLKAPILKAVQWRACSFAQELVINADCLLEVIGRLDHLIEAVYERFKDRYFIDESEYLWFNSCVVFDRHSQGCLSIFKERGMSYLSCTPGSYLTSARYYARVMQVFPPRSTLVASTSSPLPTQPEEEDQIHKLATDLKLPVKDANIRDDPQKYLYKIQIHEDNKEKAATVAPNDNPDEEKSKWSGSLMEVQCPSMR